MYRKYRLSFVAACPINRRRNRATEILPVVVLTTEKLGAMIVYLKAFVRSLWSGIYSKCVPRPWCYQL